MGRIAERYRFPKLHLVYYDRFLSEQAKPALPQQPFIISPNSLGVGSEHDQVWA